MVNLFKLLGLPDPKKNVINENEKKIQSSANPGPRSNSRADFHDLGDNVWSERTERLIPQAQKNVVYLKPDKYQRVRLDGMENEIGEGSMILVDLTSLSHMPSQKEVCKRRVESLGEINNIPVFSLNENDSLLMIPGAGMRVDTKKHRLGMKVLEHEP